MSPKKRVHTEPSSKSVRRNGRSSTNYRKIAPKRASDSSSPELSDALFDSSSGSTNLPKLQLAVTDDDAVDMQILYGIDPLVYVDTVEKNLLTNLKCPMCSFEVKFTGTAESIVDMQMHIITSHVGNKQSCPVCNTMWPTTIKKNVITRTTLEKHIVEHINTDQYPCPICPQRFPSRQLIIHHMISHAAEAAQASRFSGPFTCHFCSMSFSKQIPFRFHMSAHSSKGPFLGDDRPYCTVCNIHFNDMRQLRQHRENHGGKKTEKKQPQRLVAQTVNPCPECGKTFSDEMFLVAHMNYHTFEDGKNTNLFKQPKQTQSAPVTPKEHQPLFKMDKRTKEQKVTIESALKKCLPIPEASKPIPAIEVNLQEQHQDEEGAVNTWNQHRRHATYGRKIREVHEYQCCGETFTNKAEYSKHTEDHKVQAGRDRRVLPDIKLCLNQPEEGNLIINDQIVCNFCYLSFDTEHMDFYMEHLKSHKSTFK